MRSYLHTAPRQTAEPELGELYDAVEVVGGEQRDRVVVRGWRQDTDEVLAALGRAERIAQAYDRALVRVREVLRIPQKSWWAIIYDDHPVDTLAGARFAPEAGLAAAARIAECLAYCHDLLGTPDSDAGLPHGGVFPSAFAGPITRPLLLDVALCPLREAHAAPRDGWAAPPWLAPEQLDRHTEARTDLYGLGASIASLLLGEPLYDLSGAADPDAWLAARHKLDLSQPCEAIERLAPGVGDLVDRCVRVRLSERPASADQVADALHAALAKRAPSAMTLRHALAPRPPTTFVPFSVIVEE